jgi:hypothetical protein
METTTIRVWTPTPKAVQLLGRSRQSLMRLVDQGHLSAGKHYVRGPHKNSTITWDVDACTQRFAELARMPATFAKKEVR